MFAAHSSSCLPQLHPIALTDWLPKLGEKAFLAWLQFHSWKPMHYSTETGILLPFSLNKIIRKLGVGKATFYEKIIQPLKAFGLIQVITSEYSKQENHLVVYMYPHNLEENATKPLNPLTSEELKSTASKTVSLQSQDFPKQEQELVPNQNRSVSPTEPVQSIIKENDIIDLNKKNIINHSSNQSSNHFSIDQQIPEELTAMLNINPLFCERSEQIIKTFHRCKSHPSFTLESFLTMLDRCVFYPHDTKYFSFYLQKSLLNEWERRSTNEKSDAPNLAKQKLGRNVYNKK